LIVGKFGKTSRQNQRPLDPRVNAHARRIACMFRAASEGDAEVLEALASHCVRDLDELSHAPATVKVVLVAYGDSKIEAIKEVRAFTGMGLKEAKELVEAAPTIIKQGVAKAEADSMKHALESVGASIMLI
jgi:ribosomal protein L7/L12